MIFKKVVLITLVVALALVFLSCDIFDKKDPRVLWEYEIDKYTCVETTVALGYDGTIYFGGFAGCYSPGAETNDWFYAVNPDGSLKWSIPTPSWTFSPPAIGEDGTIYVGAEDGRLYALNPDGSLKWEAVIGTGNRWCSCPVIGYDGSIYVVASDGVLYAFDPQGQEKWSLQGYYKPVVGADGTIYCGYDDNDSNYLAALNPDGTIKSKVFIEGNIWGEFAIDLDSTVYVGTWDEVWEEGDSSYFYAISQDTVVKWRYGVYGGFVSGPVIAEDGTMYVGVEEVYDGESWHHESAAFLYALSPQGKLDWKIELEGGIYDFFTPAVGDDGTIYVVVANYGGGLYAISPSGTILWEITAKRYNDYFHGSAPSIGPDGTLYITGGNIVAIDTDSEGLASSPWPKFAGDAQNTGRAR